MAQVPRSSSSRGPRSRSRSGSAFSGENDQYADDPVVQELRRLDVQYCELQTALRAEQRALGDKFQKRFAEILERCRERLSGTPDGVCVEGARAVVGPVGSRSMATPAIQGFWKIVLQNSDEFREDIEEHDEGILDYLRLAE